jgi:hypothetical protein
MKLITILLFVTTAAFSQTAVAKASYRRRKIGGCIARRSRVPHQRRDAVDWPATPGGEYRVLRKGSSQWTCLPGLPGSPHNDDPGCFDPVFLQFIKDSIAGRTPNVQSVGISYMYGGFWVPNKSHAMGSGHEFHRWSTHHDHRFGSRDLADTQPRRIEWSGLRQPSCGSP